MPAVVVKARAPVPKAAKQAKKSQPPKKAKPKQGAAKAAKSTGAPKPKVVASSKRAQAAKDSQQLLTALSETVGEGNAVKLSSGGLHIKIRGVIPTGCYGIDEAIGRGGVPRGRLTILHGGEGGGKTTLLLQLIAQTQRMGGIAVYIDAEYKLDPEYAEALGVDLESLIYVTPDSLEGALEAISKTVEFAKAKREERDGAPYPFLVALDSMNAATPMRVLDGDVGDHHMAPHARVYSEQLPQIIKKVSKEDIALIFVSQLRKNIGLQFGDDAEIAGGNAPKHHASVILYVSRIGKIKDKSGKTDKTNNTIGNRCQAYVKKNQISPPFRKADFTIWFGEGIDGELSLLEGGERAEIVEHSGSWFKYKGAKFGAGNLKAAKALREHELRDVLEAQLREEKGW